MSSQDLLQKTYQKAIQENKELREEKRKLVDYLKYQISWTEATMKNNCRDLILENTIYLKDDLNNDLKLLKSILSMIEKVEE